MASEPTFSFQGQTVLRASITRSPGTDPDAGEIEMTSRRFGELQFERPTNLYTDLDVTIDPGRSGMTVPRVPDVETVEESRPLLNSIRIRGGLVLADGERTVTFKDLYVRDDGIEVTRFVDDEDGDTVVRLSLVDIRYFWARRGELWGSYNVLRSDGSYAPETVQADGSPVPLRRILANVILRKLPGRPSIVKAPASLDRIFPANLIYRGDNPKDELDRLLKKYRLTFALTVENRVVLSDENEPLPQEVRSGAARQIGGVTLPEGIWKRLRRRAFRHRPQAVRIVGRHVVREAHIPELLDAGYAMDETTGAPDRARLRPWSVAARSYGFGGIRPLSRFVLLSQKDQSRILASASSGRAGSRAVSDVNHWAFRMFRFPNDLLGFLPILPERAESLMLAAAEAADDKPADPQMPRLRQPPLVEAQVFEEIRGETGAAPSGGTSVAGNGAGEPELGRP